MISAVSQEVSSVADLARDLTGAESLSVSRHDQHNLEMKLSLASASVRERVGVDMFLFLPGNLHLSSIPRQELRQDFRSRLRLGTQQAVGRQASRVRELQALVAQGIDRFAQDASSLALEDVFQKTRELGAVLGELLKFESRRLRMELLAASSRSNLAPHRERILGGVEQSLKQIDQLVAATEDLCSGVKAKDIPVLDLLSHYVHSLYSDFLIRFGKEQDGITAPENNPQADALWSRIESLVRDLRQVEARRLAQIDAMVATESEHAHEIRLLRQSQIKKFFQSQMFIEVERRETLKKFSEPAAAGAAAFAALWASAFEYISKPGAHGIGVSGAVVICMGVALYVLKDRLKDKFRAIFTDRLAAILPEAEQVLSADGYTIGKVREWFSASKLGQLPPDVLASRRRADLSQIEQHLPEEALLFGQEFDLEPSYTSYGDFQRTVQQVLRVNIERFLKHLDDPYKMIGLLDGAGELRLVRSHRVYHFHVIVRLKRIAAPTLWHRLRRSATVAHTSFDKIYRVVVDKNGIDRVEAV